MAQSLGKEIGTMMELRVQGLRQEKERRMEAG